MTSKVENESIRRKQELITSFVTAIQNTKEEYQNREESPNLMNFFNKNADNLTGVFISCHKRFYSTTKMDRSGTEKSLTRDLGSNRFWMDQSCFAYIVLVEKVIAKSKTARDKFFNYIIEDDPDYKKEESNDDDMLQQAITKMNSQKETNNRKSGLSSES